MPPKGTQDDDTGATGDCTCPLGLKTTDDKTIAAAVNNSIARHDSDGADHTQNGFAVGRQDINNIVTLYGTVNLCLFHSIFYVSSHCSVCVLGL